MQSDRELLGWAKAACHILDVVPGDTVIHNGILRTVCSTDLKRGGLFGITLFGDSYRAGRRPVIRAIFRAAASLATPGSQT